jgi:hypothetical protein
VAGRRTDVARPSSARTGRTTERCCAAITDDDVRPTRKGTDADRAGIERSQCVFRPSTAAPDPNLFWKEATAWRWCVRHGAGVRAVRARTAQVNDPTAQDSDAISATLSPGNSDDLHKIP